MGTSSSSLLDEAKVNHIKGQAEALFQGFSVYYRQQYSTAYLSHIHQEVEPRREGRGQLLKHRPVGGRGEGLYQGLVQMSWWEEGRRSRERYIILTGEHSLQIHLSHEAYSSGSAARLVVQPVGGAVLTSEEEYRALIDQTCPGLLNGVEDSYSGASAPGVFPVYLHLPYTGHADFMFTQEEQRDHFLSALKTCIRHQNLALRRGRDYEGQAFLRALTLYRREAGRYESWDMLLGNEEQVLANQVMEVVLPWLQAELQSRVKGKKSERRRQWMSTVQVAHNVVSEHLIDGLRVLKEGCRQTASANQALMRSDLDQIISSRCFLEEKLCAGILSAAEQFSSQSITPYLPSILEVLAQAVSAGVRDVRHALQTHMDTVLTLKQGGAEQLKKTLSSSQRLSLESCYRQLDSLTDRLADLKQRFSFDNTQRLAQSAQIEMEQLLDSADYTLELLLQSAVRDNPSQFSIATERANHRVLKQLDHDSAVIQRRLIQEALLDITLPVLTRHIDTAWRQELQKFDQYIFSDYSSFLLVQNVYDDILTDILSKEIDRVVQEAASQKNNHLLLDSSDLQAVSQYSLIGHTPPRSSPNSPANQGRSASPPVAIQEEASSPSVGNDLCPQNDPKPDLDCNSSPATCCPVIAVRQQSDQPTPGPDPRPVSETSGPEPGSDPRPVSEKSGPEPGPDPRPVSETSGPEPGPDPRPVSETSGQEPGLRLVSESYGPEPGPDPRPVSESSGPGPDPRPVSESSGPGPDPRPVSESSGPGPDPRPVSESSGPGPDPRPVSASSGPGPDPRLVSESSGPEPDPRLVSASSGPGGLTVPGASGPTEPPTAGISSPRTSPLPSPAAPFSPSDLSVPPSDRCVPPSDLSVSLSDLSVSPAAPFSPSDLSVSPSDRSVPPSDLSVSLSDLSVSPAAPVSPSDLYVPPSDPSVSPSDLCVPLSDLSVSPSDLSVSPAAPVPPADLSVPPSDLSVSPSDPSVSPASPIEDDPSVSPTAVSLSVDSTCQHPASSLAQANSEVPPPCTEGPMRSSLASLSAIIGFESTAPPAGQRVVQRATDRAVYLRRGGEGREVERGEEGEREGGGERRGEEGEREGEKERQREEEREKGEESERGKEGEREKEGGREGEREEGEREKGEESRGEGEKGRQGAERETKEGRFEQVLVQPTADQHCSFSGLPAESANTTASTQQREGERREEEEILELQVGKEKEEGLQTPQPMACQADSDAALPLDCVSVNTELVTEVIEMEMLVTPCPHGNHTA